MSINRAHGERDALLQAEYKKIIILKRTYLEQEFCLNPYLDQFLERTILQKIRL